MFFFADDLFSLIFIIFVLIALFSFYGQISRWVMSGASAPRRVSRAPRAKRRHVTITDAAWEAMSRAGYEASSEYVQVADIGLLAYRLRTEPKLVRNSDVVMDTRYLRPFVELGLPYSASGEIRFELIDHEGRLRYADEAEYDFNAGSNTIVPGTWLPLEGKTIVPEDWNLRVLAGQTLLAMHSFGWEPVGGGVIQRYVSSDGELSDALQQALNSRQKEAVSLSDLLGDQEE